MTAGRSNGRAEEKKLTDAYNKAVDKLTRIPRGDERHFAASRAVVKAHRALQRYKQVQAKKKT